MKKALALGHRLFRCRNVVTLGVKVNFSDYSGEEVRLIREAERIYYPSLFYADVFPAMGKPVFPSAETYRFALDKIRQTALFQALGVPHPRTRVYYGKKRQEAILDDFPLPFVAKIGRGSARGEGVYLIQTREELRDYLLKVHAAYIQEYIPGDRDLRVLVIGEEPVIAYWRVAPEGGFLANLSQGGAVDLKGVPSPAVEAAVDAARACRFNDVGMDLRMTPKGPVVIEANMKYGTRGLLAAGIDYSAMMEERIRNGKI